MTKVCTKCNLEKDLDLFKKDKRQSDGRLAVCKLCYNKQNKQWNKNYRESNENAKALIIWYGIVARCENKNGKCPTYKNVKLKMTRQEFLNWYKPERLKFELSRPGIIPSVDRIDNNGNYELSNLQLLSRSENTVKMFADQGKMTTDDLISHVKKHCNTYKLSLDNFIEKLKQ
jgi:hypothetical protein